MVDLALEQRRRRTRAGWHILSDFFAIAGLFATLTGWFIVAAALGV